MRFGHEKAQEIDVKGTSVRIVKFGVEDYVCITDMAKSKSDDAQQTISNWMRNRMTIEYLGLREGLYNPDFKPLEFEGFRKDAGPNSFTMMIQDGIPQPERLRRLNEIAIHQMRVLSSGGGRSLLR